MSTAIKETQQVIHFWRYLPIALTVVIGVSLSFLTYQFMLEWEQQRVKAEFTKSAEDRALAVERAMAFNLQLLQTFESFFRVNGENLTEKKFEEFVTPYLDHYQHIQALMWVPRVAYSQREEFESEAPETAFDMFFVKEFNSAQETVRAGQRPEYLPLQYVRPMLNNENTLGFDLLSRKDLLETMRNAQDDAKIRVIAHTTLVEGSDLHGLVALLPIYHNNMPMENTEQLRRAFKGFVIGVYQLGEILDHEVTTYLEPRPIDIRVYDKWDDANLQFLYFYPGDIDDAVLESLDESQLYNEDFQKNLHVTKTFSMSGILWSVICTPSPGYEISERGGWITLSTLFLGLLATLLLAFYFYSAMRHAYYMAEAAQAANHAQSKFLANMSHQLRTPLNAITGYSELVREEIQDLNEPGIAEDMEKIHISAKYLLSLSEGILDLSKIKTGQIELHTESFKVASLIKEIEGIATPLVRKNKNVLLIQCPESVGSMHTDATRMHQILFNLVNTVSDVTEGSDVRINVSRFVHNDKEVIRFAISGNMGGGMTPSQREDMINKLSIAETARAEMDMGIRMGLVISAQLWHLMGGHIDIESEVGKGTTFVLDMPARFIAHNESEVG